MIVNLTQDGWDVVYHRAHALLAAQLGGHWPFERDEFTVNVDSAHLSQLKYESDEELVTALKQAPVKSLEWTFVKQ